MQMLFIGRALVQPYRRAADGIVTGILRCVEIFKQEVPGRETVQAHRRRLGARIRLSHRGWRRLSVDKRMSVEYWLNCN
jgi:hypothetical protein